MQCGSCWAFAGLSTIESRVLIQSGCNFTQYPINLAEQQAVSGAGQGTHTHMQATWGRCAPASPYTIIPLACLVWALRDKGLEGYARIKHNFWGLQPSVLSGAGVLAG